MSMIMIMNMSMMCFWPEFIFLVQVCMTKALDGVVVKVPEGVNDQR